MTASTQKEWVALLGVHSGVGGLDTYFAKCDPVHICRMIPTRSVTLIVFRRDETTAGLDACKGDSAGG